MNEYNKNPLSGLLLHVKNFPISADYPISFPLERRHEEVVKNHRLAVEKWFSELVGKTQELSLSIAGKEASLRKLLDDFGSIDDYDNDDVIELHSALKKLLGGSQEPSDETITERMEREEEQREIREYLPRKEKQK